MGMQQNHPKAVKVWGANTAFSVNEKENVILVALMIKVRKKILS